MGGRGKGGFFFNFLVNYIYILYILYINYIFLNCMQCLCSGYSILLNMLYACVGAFCKILLEDNKLN